MDFQDGAGPGSGAGEDRSKVIELRERILQLAGHDCHEEEEKSRAELREDLNMCKRDTLVELCRSFDIAGSRANRKDELVSFLMKFSKNKCSRTDATIPVKVSDLREQILQLAEHAYLEEEEKSRSELLERLNVCKRDTLIELCRSFDIIGSRANRKEELVSFLLNFVKEHSSAIDGTNPDKKIKKRRRATEENLSSGKPLKKDKREGTALEIQDEEEANVREAVENQRNYSECDGKGNRFLCADSKNGNFSNDKANLQPTVRKNGTTSDNVDAATLNEEPIHTNEQALTTIPFAKVVATAEFDSTSMKDLKKKKSSVTKKIATPKNDHKVKSCGKKGSKGDANPRKLAMKPSKDELKEAIVLILDSADFATMTFGDVVKEVDKYFGKDLFERKPLIRSLIEEELFRLSEEAEKKELEEEEAAEAKARAEQSTKEVTQVQTVETGIDKRSKHIAGQNCKSKDCGNDNEKDVRGESSVKINSKANTHTKTEDKEPPNDGKWEKVSSIINNDVATQGSRNGEVAMVNVKNNNVDALEGSKDDRTKEACNGEHDDNEYGRTDGGRRENGEKNADNVNGCEAEEPRSLSDDERVEHDGNGKAKVASNENSSNVAIHSDNDGNGKEGNIDVEQSLTDSGGEGKAEDANHNANTKVDVDSSKNGAAENGKAGDDVKADINRIPN